MLRKRRGMTQSELARRAGMHRPAIVMIENGRQSDLNIEALIRVADALGVSIDMLVRGDVLEEDEDKDKEALAATA